MKAEQATGTDGRAEGVAPADLPGADVVRLATEFRVRPPEVDGHAAILRYELVDDAAKVLIDFAETITFPESLNQDDEVTRQLVELLAVAAGTSYFKVAAPPLVSIEFGPVGPELAELLPELYDHGMREFAVTNSLPVPMRVEFAFEPIAQPRDEGSEFDQSSPLRALVPVGGGKDSALVMSVFPEATPFAIGPPVPSVRVAQVVGAELLVARRQIDPKLRMLNETGALNGHIPVTAITSAISVLTAYLTGHTDVLMGNERSASEPTRWVGSHAVNHQYSKSFEFETSFAAAVNRLSSGKVRYFSVLRPFSELAIARGLVQDRKMAERFLSCNHAFTIWRDTEQSRTASWCRNCPKCRFTALILAPFATPELLTATMGSNIFDDPEQVSGFGVLWDEVS